MKRATPFIAAAFLALAAGCSDSHLLSGTYRSTTKVVVPGAPGLEGDGAFLILQIRHYGPQAGGKVEFSSQPDLPKTPSGTCSCRYLLKGAVQAAPLPDDAGAAGATDLLTFQFHVPGPTDKCSADLEVVRGMEVVVARLQASDHTGDTLQGQVFVGDEPGPESWTFERTVEMDDLPQQLDKCDDDAVEP